MDMVSIVNTLKTVSIADIVGNVVGVFSSVKRKY